MQTLPTSPNPSLLLPPYPTSKVAKLKEARAELLDCVEFLFSQGQDETKLKLFTNLIVGTIFDEEIDQKFKQLAWSAAIEIYDHAMQNADWEEVLIDPDNPRNWKGYGNSQS